MKVGAIQGGLEQAGRLRMSEIERPPVLDTSLILPWARVADMCKVRTEIDYEGMNDAECELIKGHPGDWHYVEDGPVWWRITPRNR